MPRLRRKERADYDPDHVPEEEVVEPVLSEPHESSEPEPSEPSVPVKTTWEGRDAQLDRKTHQEVVSAQSKIEKQEALAKQAREEAFRKAKAESDRIKAEQTTQGQDTITHMGIQMTQEQYKADFSEETVSDVSKTSPLTFKPNLPDPDTFVGIPGPASAPRPESISEKIQEKIDTSLQTMETAFVDFETEMYHAGREMGAEAQEAYKEEDYTEAFLKGMAAFSPMLAV